MSSADLAATTTQTQAQTQAQAFDVMATIRNPLTWTIVSAAAFISTFGAVIQTSGSITRIDPSILKVWWVGTILSSFVFLLSSSFFFFVFFSSFLLSFLLARFPGKKNRCKCRHCSVSVHHAVVGKFHVSLVDPVKQEDYATLHR
jgi:ABC-type Fe3+-siderophore transport system permease subunit